MSQPEAVIYEALRERRFSMMTRIHAVNPMDWTRVIAARSVHSMFSAGCHNAEQHRRAARWPGPPTTTTPTQAMDDDFDFTKPAAAVPPTVSPAAAAPPSAPVAPPKAATTMPPSRHLFEALGAGTVPPAASFVERQSRHGVCFQRWSTACFHHRRQ
jgi:hypothetical protein